MLFAVLLVVGASADPEPTTTRTYDLEVPGSDPIRIVEGEPLWPSRSEERALRKGSPLQHFLATYSDKRNKGPGKNKEAYQMESVELIEKPSDEEPANRLSNWDLLHYQQHNHPFEDKKGWVSMEPVPWSVSKISKWESSYRPNAKPSDQQYEETHKPNWNNKPTNNYDIYYLDSKPENKPTAIYGQKVHVDYDNKKYQHKHDNNCRHSQSDDEDDIITDGLPPNFPKPHESNRRKGTEMFPETHPFAGDGEWVLLSTTKGYKHPQQRQRALKIPVPQSIGAHRSVRLTVLPPLENSKVNMTTSHGGLLQVESTFQTVEQSRKQYKKEKLKKRRPLRQKQQQQQQPQQQIMTATTKRNAAPDSSTVLAAVGAGMIPATMAMLVPIALGGRRKREINHVSRPPVVQLRTLPGNLY